MRRAWIQLGRFGDIINVLPLLKEEADRGRRHTLILSSPYADLIDGVSYCDVEPLGIHYGAIEQAHDHAKKNYDDVIVSQVYGWSRTTIARETESFLMDSWRMAGKLSRWGKVPLIFDRRRPDREKTLIDRLVRTSRPLILVSCSSYSSPFRFKTDLMRTLQRFFGRDHHILDLDRVRAERFFDLLGLFDRAKCLVSVDTGHLHLAKASGVPVCAFITDTPTTWHGTAPHPNHIARVAYSEYHSRKTEIMEAITSLHTRGSTGNNSSAPEIKTAPVSTRRIFHIWSDYDRSGDSKRRHEFSKKTWETERRRGKWVDCPVRDSELARTSRDVGDPLPMPYIHDLINQADAKAEPDDILLVTNDDISIVEGITEKLMEVTSARAAWAHRWDFRYLGKPKLTQELQAGTWCVGSDLFAFTSAWWRKKRKGFPDMVLGREAWDWVMRDLIKDTGGFEIHVCIYHESHGSFWCTGSNRNENKGNQHNRRLAREWLLKRGKPIRELQHFK